MVTALSVTAAVVVLVGTLLAAGGAAVVRRYRPVRRAAPSDPGTVGNAAGSVAVEGKAGRHDRLVTAPLTGRDCLAYVLDVEKREMGYRTMWQSLPGDEDGVVLAVEGEAGSVLVDAGTATTAVEESARVSLDRDDMAEGAREEYRRIFATVEAGKAASRLPASAYPSLDLAPGEKLRVTERRLDVGDTVFAFGHVESPPEGPVRIAAPTDGDGAVDELRALLAAPSLVADGTSRDVADRTSETVQTGWALLLVGVALLAFGAGLLGGWIG